MSKTINQVILEKSILNEYGAQINEFKEKLINAIEERIRNLESDIVIYAQMFGQEKRVEQIVQKIKVVKEIKYKTESDILSITENEIKSLVNDELNECYLEFVNNLTENKYSFSGIAYSGNTISLNPKEKILTKKDTEQLLKNSKIAEEIANETGNIIGGTLQSCKDCGVVLINKEFDKALKENDSPNHYGGNLEIESSEDGKIYFKKDGKTIGFIDSVTSKVKVEFKDVESIKGLPETIVININMTTTDITQAESFAKRFIEQLKQKGGKLD